MALQGSLDDIEIVDLFQFPHLGRKTGMLVIQNAKQGEANLYYRNGQIYHAAWDTLEGLPAIVEILAFRQADFEFFPGVEENRQTLDMDIHHALMLALKTLDERRSAEGFAEVGKKEESELSRTVHEFAEKYSWIRYLCIIGKEGEVLVQRKSGRNGDAGEALPSVFLNFLRSYPRPAVKKMLLQDDSGIVAMNILAPQKMLVLVAGPDITLGAVTSAISRLTDLLARKGCPVFSL